MSLRVVEVTPENAGRVNQHLDRHLLESGRYGIHWLPFDPATLLAKPYVNVAALDFEYDQVGWARWFAVMDDSDEVVGHLSLKGSRFSYVLHRCELGMGLEYPYWRMGLGQRLLDVAIEKATSITSVEWLDLHVLSCNEPAHRLYQRNGFRETSRVTDFCRIDGQSVDDIFMSLRVLSEANVQYS